LRARWLHDGAFLLGASLLRVREKLAHASRYFLIAFAGGVQVDQRGAGARVAHPFHQFPEAGALRGRHRVPGGPQVVEAETGQADHSPGLIPERAEARPAQPPALRPDEDQPVRLGVGETLQLAGELGHDVDREGDCSLAGLRLRVAVD